VNTLPWLAGSAALPLLQQPVPSTEPAGPPAAAVGLVGVLGVLYMAFVVGMILLGVLATVFWIWMLVDCATRQFPPHRENEKVVWILVIVLAHGLGSIIYYFVVKRKADRGEY